jgi:hypothetical protein
MKRKRSVPPWWFKPATFAGMAAAVGLMMAAMMAG